MVKLVNAVFAAEVRQGPNGDPQPFNVFSEGNCDKFPSAGNNVPIVVTVQISHIGADNVSILRGRMLNTEGKSIGGGFEMKLSSPEAGNAGVMDMVFPAHFPDVNFAAPGQYYGELSVNGEVVKKMPLGMTLTAKA